MERIDFHDPDELRHWARLFGITIQALVLAMHTVGPEARDIAFHLKIVPDTSSLRSL